MSKTKREPYKKRQRAEGVVIGDEQLNLPPVRCIGHCGEKFQPIAKHNHVCPKCTEANKEMNGVEFKVGRK